MRLANVILTAVATLAVGALAATPADASAIAFDSAGDSAYNGGLAPGVNGGYGWGGPWVFGTAGARPFVGSSSANGDGDPGGTGDINTPRSPLGRAWGLTDTVRLDRSINTMYRPLAGALAVGQTLAADFDVGTIFPTFSVAVQFEGTLRAAVTATGSRSDYMFADGYDYGPEGNLIDSGIPVSSRGVHVAFTPLDGSTAQLSIASIDTGATASAVFPYANVVALGFYNENGPFPPYDGSDDIFFNNISITPEPGAAALAMLVSTLLLVGPTNAARPRAPKATISFGTPFGGADANCNIS